MGDGLSWSSLFSFISNLPPTSSFYRATHKDAWTWDSGAANAYLLADIIDLLQGFMWQHALANSDPKKPRPQQPERFPRPGEKKKQNTIGKEPIKVSDFDAWWNS